MSKLFRHYLAGQLALAKEMTYCFAPNINSFKRFQSGTFAPTKAAWSLDNRTAGFRVITGGAGTRIECRIPGADCNPYLAFAATLAAGLYGIDNELELPEVFEGNMYAAKRVPNVPKTLREAVVGHYVHAGAWEQHEYDRRITDWELIRNFERA